ncbi:MAG: hypothetical protein R3E10_19540 [Gemmatimonadota bacterium]
MKRVGGALALAGLVWVAAAAPLVAQRGPDMEQIVRQLLAQKLSADAAARTLVSEYRQTPEQAVHAMVRGGFAKRPTAVAALRSLEMKPTDAVQTFKAVGYSAGEVQDVLAETGRLVELSCIDRDGYPAPCGNPGGSAATAMGAVAVTPASQSYTDSIVTLESSNIPQVQVLLAGQPLPILEMTSTRVRARLPSSPVTAALSLRRVSDGVEGVVVPLYTVSQWEAPLNWVLLATEALSGAVEDAQYWISGARIEVPTCIVNGPIAVAGPGVLRSSTGFQGRVRQRLEAAGAPATLAQAWDGAFRNAWHAWASQTTIPGLPWYPDFALYPGDQAPPTANVPTPVSALISAGTIEMQQEPLKVRLQQALGAVSKTQEAEGPLTLFAGGLGARFLAWSTKALVLNVLGSGPVPSRSGAPGAVPVGPVQSGMCSGQNVIPAFPF